MLDESTASFQDFSTFAIANTTPFGFTSRLQKETFLQRWFTSCCNVGNQSNVLAPLRGFQESNRSPIEILKVYCSNLIIHATKYSFL
ncbi:MULTISPECIES: hypothetical protein [unclassified Nostoc]|uniref:hypothetical protein n=1 Tax=unclassified Nostoc TaxID=2593658 RepID=UPI002604ABDB|nr:hypothetical protein [Nostoc sp. S13]MDF5737153.1 hypothetical protein [Nostoc sp. S13]